MSCCYSTTTTTTTSSTTNKAQPARFVLHGNSLATHGSRFTTLLQLVMGNERG